MENNILVKMEDDGVINIINNGILKCTINKENREINAKNIYETLDYKNNDTYTLNSENKENIDKSVFDALVKLYQEIIVEVNQLSKSDSE